MPELTLCSRLYPSIRVTHSGCSPAALMLVRNICGRSAGGCMRSSEQALSGQRRAAAAATCRRLQLQQLGAASSPAPRPRLGLRPQAPQGPSCAPAAAWLDQTYSAAPPPAGAPARPSACRGTQGRGGRRMHTGISAAVAAAVRHTCMQHRLGAPSSTHLTAGIAAVSRQGRRLPPATRRAGQPVRYAPPVLFAVQGVTAEGRRYRRLLAKRLALAPLVLFVQLGKPAQGRQVDVLE